ncbi:RNA polymerase sigma-70 factor [Chitinophaga solisilvae]|uniref:RNA polymerase sigma-70 factor n=1 Tax=Chitinophaga solisilvae TaxID=1233460 RepID=UPI00136F104E|nr:RNA polymerase sigma-70 factor [Chitinophaga solisilvae]
MGEAELKSAWMLVCQDDDQPSFRMLFDFFYSRLVLFAADVAGSREAAEEVVSDVFVQLWKNRKTAGIKQLKTYLYTAVRHRCYNYVRDGRRHQVLPLEAAASAAAPVLPALEWKELQQQLDDAMTQLSPQGRTIFRMIREEGFKYKEVAAILDISPRTVETQLVRAINRLQQVLRQAGSEVRP